MVAAAFTPCQVAPLLASMLEGAADRARDEGFRGFKGGPKCTTKGRPNP
jgi:hypothetical protein